MSQTAAALDISTEVARIHAAAYERGDEPVNTTINAELAICVVQLALLPVEQLLISRRELGSVRDQHEALDHLLAPSLSAAVERATGRMVSTFSTATHPEAGLSVLIFTFAPAVAGPRPEEGIGGERPR